MPLTGQATRRRRGSTPRASAVFSLLSTVEAAPSMILMSFLEAFYLHGLVGETVLDGDKERCYLGVSS